ERKALKDVEAIELRLRMRQVPAWPRRRPSHSITTVQRASALEDAPNRAHCRPCLRPNPPLREFPVNSHGTKLPQRALVFQISPDLKDQIFHHGIRSVRRDLRTILVVTELNALEALSASPSHPTLNMRQRNVELPRDLPQRLTIADRADHLSTPLFQTLFYSSRGPFCSLAIITKVPSLTRSCCHSSDPQLLSLGPFSIDAMHRSQAPVASRAGGGVRTAQARLHTGTGQRSNVLR